MGYNNPIIKGFHPDPSICKRGNDYYLVTSSFEYFPGIPVYHSTDLINWELIGNCIDRVTQLPMEEAAPSGGIWAPTIRYYEGVFYVTATFSERGNFIIHAAEPGGEWSDPVWVEMDGIDPSMYFENGKMYYCANDCGSRSHLHPGEGISLAEVDVNTGKVLSEIRRIWEGTGGGFLEAPHLYRIGGKYYLLAAEGGTRFNHMVTVARSDSLWGKYEAFPGNPLLTNRHDASKQVMCCGHADLIEDKEGNLWAVHLGTRPASGDMSHLGRETFLTPVTFAEGWPRTGNGGKASLYVGVPSAEQKITSCWHADFSKGDFDREFIFLRKPELQHYRFRNGALVLQPSRVRMTDREASPVFAAVRQPDFECEINAVFEFQPQEQGDEAGIAIYLTPDFIYRIFKRRELGDNYLIVEKTAEDFRETACRERIPEGPISVKIRARREAYEFYYGVVGEELRFVCRASTRFLACEQAGKCFTGVVIGMYAQALGDTEAEAEFRSFEQYVAGGKCDGEG